MTITSTYTYATMEISKAAWDEIAEKLKEAGYTQAFHDFGRVLDMHGIALVQEREKPD